MSPMLTDWGLKPVEKSTLGAKVGVVAPLAVVFSRMETVLLLVFAVAKSSLPSPLKSPMLTEVACEPTVKSTLVAKVGVVALVVVLSRMETLAPFWFDTAKSGLLSLLKSPILTEVEPEPVVKSTLGLKVGVVAPVAVVLSRMEALLLLV